MTPAENLQSMINGRLAQIDQLEAEVVIMRKLLRELGGPKPNGKRAENSAAFDNLLKQAPKEGWTVKEIADGLGRSVGTIKVKVWTLHKAGKLVKVSTGRYRAA